MNSFQPICNNAFTTNYMNSVNATVRMWSINWSVPDNHDTDPRHDRHGKDCIFSAWVAPAHTAEVQYRRCATLAGAITLALDYERSHHGVDPGRARSLRSERRLPHGPEPMKINNLRDLSRDDCRQCGLCYKCQKPGHLAARCPQRASRVAPPRRRPVLNNVGLAASSPWEGSGNDDADDADDEAEHDDDQHRHDRYTLNVVNCNEVTKEDARHDLIRRSGSVEGKTVTVLLNSGAGVNVIRPGIATQVIEERDAQIELFDGSVTKVQKVRRVRATVHLGQYIFTDKEFLEWEMPGRQDVIFGRPMHYKFQPIIDWRSERVHFPVAAQRLIRISKRVATCDLWQDEITVVEAAEFALHLQDKEYAEHFRMKVSAVDTAAGTVPAFQQPQLTILSTSSRRSFQTGCRPCVMLSSVSK
ncbi:TPA: hypothetical protein N0F65_011198 [Lagenidium giganteum]|uniref:CCHC-type domain-containing protein n=1 Tax=Lagenidium giganteum TaxID=4803 RepID=A0AAV2Z749_9STRA|nr:TPA: hypothetical protein N0F65_011198 [Lagenidium giganteum]